MNLRKFLKKLTKRNTLETNRMQGQMAEMAYVSGRNLEGYETKRTGRGSDYAERKVDPWTGKKGPKTLVEVKSGGAKLSRLQKKTKKKSSRYRVERGGIW
jgi:hypothetical protein